MTLPARRRSCAILLLTAGILAQPLSAPAAELRDQEVRDAVRREMAGVGFGPPYQEDLPGLMPAEATERAADLERTRRTKLDVGTNWLPGIPPEMVRVLEVLMWLLLAAMAILVVVRVGSELVAWRRAPAAARAAMRAALARQGAAGPAAAPPTSLDRIRALAASGRFAAAIHQLLLLGLETVRGRFDPALDPSLTSREVLRRAALPGQAREALAILVRASEVSHFGSHVPGAADFARCLDGFTALDAASAPGAEGA